jgi:tetratricopeptide (TPR) repeat protein
MVVVAGELDEGAALLDQALALNQNLAWVWLFSGTAKVYLGDPETAIEQSERAMRLSPQDPHTFGMETVVAQAHFCLGRDAVASEWAESALRRRPDFLVAACVCAAAGALSGRPEIASRAMERVRTLAPGLRLDGLRGFLPFRRSEHFDRWAEGLRLAGLPE